MAYNVSNEYKQVIYSGDSRHKIKILFNNVELQEADRYCERATIKSRIIPNGAKRFSLNNFISKEVEIILHDIDTSIIQDKVSISIGTLVGNSYEYVPIGIFNIQGTPTTDKNKITIKLRDNSVKFDFNYNAKPLIDSGGGSATKLQILQDICTKANVTCNISSFIGSTDSIGIYDNTITARQYIADIAEQAGKIATINRNGELIFVNLNSLTIWNIPLSIVEKYEIGKSYRIGKVVYEDAIRKYETASTNYDTLYLDASNPYISSQSQVNSILQQVNNFAIDSVKTGKILGNPAIDGYDIINIYDDKTQGNPSVFKTLATNELVYTGVLINTFDTQIGEEERKENVSIVGEATFKKWAKTNINNINGEIDIQAGKIDNVEKEINPTQDATGTTFHLEDSTDAELVNFEIEGKTIQASTPSPSSPSELVSVGTYNSETGKYEIKIKTRGNNLLKGMSTPKDDTYWVDANYYFTPLENGWGKFEYNNTSGSSTVFINAKVRVGQIELKPNTLYTIVAEIRNGNVSANSGCFFQLCTANPTASWQTAKSIGYTNINNGGKYIFTSTTKESFEGVASYFDSYLRIAAGYSGSLEIRLSLIEGTYSLDNFEYEPYKSNTYLYTLNQPLRSIGDTTDLLYIKNGMLYVERKIGSVDLSTITWGKYGHNVSGYSRYSSTTIPNIKYVSANTQLGNGMAEKYVLDVGSGITSKIDKIAIDVSQVSVVAVDSPTGEFIYELAEPTTEELGQTNIPSTYKTITHINTTDDNEPNMNITYVRDTQLTNYVEEHISQIIVNEEGISSRVQTIEDSDYDSRLNAVEQKQTDTDLTIDIISTNIDKTSGEVRSVTTDTGFTFNENGLNIKKSDTDYNTLIDNTGTYYKDGETIISMTNKDGFLAKDFRLQGQHYYSYNGSTPSNPLASENYDFVDERIEVEVDGQTQYAYATFYNGEV